MNWEKFSFLLAAASIVASSALAVWSKVQARHGATSEQVDEVQGRVTVLETRLETMPGPDNMAAFREEVAGKLASIEAYQQANHRRLSRIEDYLLNKQ